MHTLPKPNQIKLHDAKSFTNAYMRSEELDQMLKEDFSKYFIVRIEEMYRLVKHNVPASRSDSHIAMYITEGESVMKIGSALYKVQKDEMLFVPAGQVFSFETSHVNKGFLMIFHSDLFISRTTGADYLKEFEFLKVWGDPHIKPDSKTAPLLHHILNRLLEDYIENGLKNTSIIRSYLSAILHEINSIYKPQASQHPVASVAIVNRFKELLITDIKTSHLVSEYASSLNVSPNHLNKTIKAITGKSPTKWIDESLIAEAKVLLMQSNLSVSEIAMEIGFQDPSYFTRLYKKYEGATPTTFRRMIEKS